MSSEVQRPDDSPSTSGGSSDVEQRESVPTEQEREQAQPKKKETKISSKTAAKLSTSAKRYNKKKDVSGLGSCIQKELSCDFATTFPSQACLKRKPDFGCTGADRKTQ